MVDSLNRNLSFFRTLRNNKRVIESYDIDFQFRSVADYLNNEIIPAVNVLVSGALPGINGSANYFLTNAGDGSVTFMSLNEVIVNNTITFNKLEKTQNSGKVLVSNNLGGLDLATGPTHANMVLTYNDGNVPEYKFITTNNIEDRAITTADFADGIIQKEHLSPIFTNYLNAIVPLGAIVGNQLENSSITSEKIATQTIAGNLKLGYIPNVLPINPQGSFSCQRQHIKNGVISPNKIRNDTIGSRHFNMVKCITRNKLAPNIVDESWLLRSPNTAYVPTNVNDPNAIANQFKSFMLSPNFKINRAMLEKTSPSNLTGGIKAKSFVPHVQAAFNRFGCH